MISAAESWTPFSVSEWKRLSSLAHKFEPAMRLSFTKATITGKRVNRLELRNTITTVVAETCDTTARVYGLVFNPNSSVYTELIDSLVDYYAGLVDSPRQRASAKRILPADAKVSTFGLDSSSAVALTQLAQGGASLPELTATRRLMLQTRGNRIASTETSRAVNRSMIALFQDNFPNVEKARRLPVEYIGTSRQRIQANPNKTWMTRRDEKVCKYCEPLDGITARLDAEFDTQYGLFECPPIHPFCHCYLIFG